MYSLGVQIMQNIWDVWSTSCLIRVGVLAHNVYSSEKFHEKYVLTDQQSMGPIWRSKDRGDIVCWDNWYSKHLKRSALSRRVHWCKLSHPK